MNYTENYHLPQWEENDRIMRTDFNEAMSSLESGLTVEARAVGGLRSRMLPQERDAYRQAVQQLVHHGPGGASETMWINPLASLEDVTANGDGWTGSYGILLGERPLPTVEGIWETAEEWEKIDRYHSEKTTKASVVFTSDGYGMMESVQLISRIRSASSQEFTFTITCTRLDKYGTVQTAGPFTSVSYITAIFPTKYTVNFRLDPGGKYRMEYSVPEDTEFKGEHYFRLGDPGTSEPGTCLTFTERPLPWIIDKSITPPVGYTGAVGILRWKGDGTVTLVLNGAALTPVSEKPGLNAVGESCMEREYEIPQLPEGTLDLALQSEKGEGDLWVYDYGLIWQ